MKLEIQNYYWQLGNTFKMQKGAIIKDEDTRDCLPPPQTQWYTIQALWRIKNSDQWTYFIGLENIQQSPKDLCPQDFYTFSHKHCTRVLLSFQKKVKQFKMHFKT